MRAIRLPERNPITLTHVWYALPGLILLAAIWGSGQIAPNDFWWHIRTGEVILSTRHIPRVDLYTFTHPGEPWIYQAWLMQIGLYLIYQAGGAPLSLFVHALLIVGGYLLLQRGLLRITRGNVRLSAVLTILAAVLGMENWAVRPQGISFLLFGWTLFLLIGYQHGRKAALWLLPPTFLLWVNAHGGFIFGLALVGSFVLGELWDAWRQRQPLPLREVALPGATTLAVLALNPVGPLGIARYVLSFVQHRGTRTLNLEFQPLTIRTLSGALFVTLVILLTAILLRRRYRPSAFETLALLGLGLLALWAIRNPPWFGFVAALVAARALAMTPGQRKVPRPRRRADTILLLTLIALDIICLPWFRSAFPQWRERRGVIMRDTPIAATAYACEHLPADARIFNEMGYGSYIIWGCPRLPVFIDTRVELYPLEEWQDYLAISIARYDWQRLLDRHGITHLLLSAGNQPYLIEAASESPCWKELYRDEISAIFERVGEGICPEP